MKKAFRLLVTSFIFMPLLFIGCNVFNDLNIDNDNSIDLNRKDILALRHLQDTHILSEETLASQVINFLNVNSVERSAAPSSTVISKTTTFTSKAGVGFAETTRNNRSVDSVIEPSIIPFYIFTLESQSAEKQVLR
jgi:L-cystine uptake protein TcyP (sodium:dicarboxylate symporter family)